MPSNKRSISQVSLVSSVKVSELPDVSTSAGCLVNLNGVPYWSTGSEWINLQAPAPTLEEGAVLQNITSTIGAQVGVAYKGASASAPTYNDGAAMWWQNITPIKTSSEIIIDGQVHVDTSSNGKRITLACWRGPYTLVGVATDYVQSGGKGVMIPFKFRDYPGVTTQVTYSLRIFSDAATTLYVSQGSTGINGWALAAGSVIETKEIA